MIIVKIAIPSCIKIALFFISLLFLFTKMDAIYWIKLIMFELNILYKLVLANPLKLEIVTVKNSGIEVAIPAMLPVVLGFNFKFSAIPRLNSLHRNFQKNYHIPNIFLTCFLMTTTY